MMPTRREFVGALLAQNSAPRPNVILIVADDLGYGELGCQGNPDVPTPHIDSLATNGVRFTNGYVTAPFCCPSRAGLMSGRYQTRFGHELNVVGKRNLDPEVGLPLSETTMAEALRAASYRTACVGKWHLGTAAKFHPQRRGFDEFFGFLQEGHFFAPPPYRGLTTRLRVNEPPYDDNNPLMRGTEVIEEKGYLTNAFSREACAFIDRNARQPFFLYLPYNAVHSPMQARVEELRKHQGLMDEQRRVFAAMLADVDSGVRRVLETLRRHGIERNTIVIFLSDNGGPTAELTSSNKPLRGGKGQLFEGGIRVPFLIQWKGRIRGGRTLDAPVSALDLFPTVCAAAGAGLPKTKLDGVNLLPSLAESATIPQRDLFWRYGANLALRRADLKIVKQGEEVWRLYDLARDLGETTDLSASRAREFMEMRRAADEWNAQMAPPLWS